MTRNDIPQPRPYDDDPLSHDAAFLRGCAGCEGLSATRQGERCWNCGRVLPGPLSGLVPQPQPEQGLDALPIRGNSELRSRVHAACQKFGRVHPRGYSGAYRAFKEAFGLGGVALAAYDDLPQSRATDALTWLDAQIAAYSAGRLDGWNA